MKNSPFVSKGLSDTAQLAQQIISTTRPDVASATILALSGDLGSGKTAFVKALASALGIKETITSPTFVIEQIYVLPKGVEHAKVSTHVAATPFNRLIHIDAYRLEKASELERLGWAEITSDPKNLICLEWPENVAGLSQLSQNAPNTRQLKFRFIDENTREISFE